MNGRDGQLRGVGFHDGWDWTQAGNGSLAKWSFRCLAAFARLPWRTSGRCLWKKSSVCRGFRSAGAAVRLMVYASRRLRLSWTFHPKLRCIARGARRRGSPSFHIKSKPHSSFIDNHIHYPRSLQPISGLNPLCKIDREQRSKLHH